MATTQDTSLPMSPSVLAKRWLASRGIAVRWISPTLAQQPEQQLRIDFSMLAAHLASCTERPYFVNIGAHDGITLDPLWPFVRQFKWPGVMLEPLPDVFERLVENYRPHPQVQLINAALGPEDGYTTLYSVEVTDPQTLEMSLDSSFSRDILMRSAYRLPGLKSKLIERRVRTMSVESLLAEIGNRQIDILKTDTEGYDLEILKLFDLSKIRPSLICAEHVHLDRNGKRELIEILVRGGLKSWMGDCDMIGYRRPAALDPEDPYLRLAT